MRSLPIVGEAARAGGGVDVHPAQVTGHLGSEGDAGVVHYLFHCLGIGKIVSVEVPP